MKLIKFTLQNFRCYQEEITIPFEELTTIIGTNDSGKSSILDALEIFFDQAKIDQDDCCKLADNSIVRLTAEFGDLPDPIIIDTTVPTTFEREALLNEDGLFEVTQEFDCSLKTPKAVTSLNCYHPVFNERPLVEHTIRQLKDLAGELNVDLETVNRTISSEIRAAIRSSSDNEPLERIALSTTKGEGKNIWSSLKDYLPLFAIFRADRPSSDKDAEAQEPLNVAIKSAVARLEERFLEITREVELEVSKVANLTLDELRGFDSSLASVLNAEITTGPLHRLFSVSVRGDNEVPMNKRGSGVRRLFLLSFFRAQAKINALADHGRSIIYAIEESETGQHPENQRMVISALTELSESPFSQVILTTHSPMLARAIDTEGMLFLEKHEDHSRSLGGLSAPDDFRRVAKTLGVLPDHGVSLFIFVEGTNDIDFLKGISSALLADGNNDIPDLVYLEKTEKIIFVPQGGNSLIYSVTRFSPLNVNEFHLYDRDNPLDQDPKYIDAMNAIPRREGVCVLCTGKKEMENYIHKDAIVEYYRSCGSALTLEAQYGDFDDVPNLLAKDFHRISESTKNWDELKADKQKERMSKVKRNLNRECSALMTQAMLDEIDSNGDVTGWFREISRLLV